MADAGRRAAIYKQFRNAAESGQRCPTSPELQATIGYVPPEDSPQAMALDGVFKLMVYGGNWRVIEFPDGLRTKLPPHNGQPYLTVDKIGGRQRTKSIHGARP